MNNGSLEKNAIGRLVPTTINNMPAEPYKGVGKHRPSGRKHSVAISTCADYPEDGNKLVSSLKEALVKAGLRDGVTISTHHHFRNGDLIANQVFDIAAELGIKHLVWAPSASFPCHKSIIKHLETGVVHHIEGSMNGDLGRFCSQGKMNGMGVLRSHGGRYQAIQDGELHIDIAVIAAPAADAFGNANGVYGKTACGSLYFALADSEYADKVIVVTDNLMPFPCVPWQIQGNNVDYTVVIDQVGIPEKIVSGTTQITRSPDRLLLAEMTARFCDAAGIIRNGFSFQAGAGGTALSIGIFFAEILKKKGLKGSFARGGSNKYLVQMLEEGLTGYILDGQTFDLDGVRSMRDNSNHVPTSPFTSYNYHGKGNFASMVDVVILGATEVDLNFNGNVVTHSDGYLLHGIGGWQNCLFSKCVILPIPLFRGRVPVIRDTVTTICGPGELIDVIVTERGIAINPLRSDLQDAVKRSSLPIKSIEELKAESERICGKPARPNLGDEIVAAVKWVDGTVLDSIKVVRAG
ncbi:MAG TPA: citrate lyase subunit alpha [Nitrospirota bacterium]|nr:citrate lyase subunit alpha [Nitrospirota bacterium]